MKFDEAIENEIKKVEDLAEESLKIYKSKPHYDELRRVFCTAYMRGLTDARVQYIQDICAEIKGIAQAAGVVDDEIDDKDLN
jgi:hypothetical protein